MEPGESSLLPQLFIIFLLTFVNAFFASAEMAMVSCNKNKINTLAEEGDKKAITLLNVLNDQTRFLSTIQVGITLAGFFSSASAASTISRDLAIVFDGLGVPYARTFALILVTLILSYITLVFGELVPKRIALQNAEAVAMRSAGTIGIVSKIAYPFVKFLSFSTIVILKIIGKYSEDVEEKISEEELKSYIRVSQEQGVINLSGEEMIVKIMDFDDKMAYEIMTPRTSIYMVDYNEFNESTVREMLEMGYSRVPVFKDNTDNIIGTLYIKDLFLEYSENSYEKINLDNCIKEPYFVPETKKIDQLLKELQFTKNYMAILIDEYGGFSGMVTMEDIVEEIVGEIEDEYDKEEPTLEKIDKNIYLIDGAMEIDTVNDKLGIELNSENHETLSGLLIELLGFIPEEDQVNLSVVYEDKVVLKELSVKDKKIEKIELTLLDE
ncbi:hemolysin family protein [Peptoniphilus stercorisuis]|uniref:Hemolysin n=1 Tax=Peptoniphilus stercorisuis TaxID=1436965 RepID=A0ABS4KD17_9FIRM|nr:hemolysin family protein [Peptoniphilus stercorisuis]MBP2025677.1 putative hemolysin [Peptoniphilus stercorisuis]